MSTIRKNRKYEQGQTISESVICLLFLCLVMFGLLQLFLIGVSQMILDYSSFYLAHSAAIGYYGRDGEIGENADGFILNRCMKVAAIGTSGDLDPRFLDDFQDNEFAQGTGPMSQFAWERERIPEYVQYGHWLDYEYWPYLEKYVDYQGDMVEATVSLDYPIELPMKSAFWENEEMEITGRTKIRYYAQDYLEDPGSP